MAKAEIKDGKLLLPNETVVFTFNRTAPRAINGDLDHDGSILFTGASRSWILPRFENGQYLDILAADFDDTTEREAIRKLMEDILGKSLNHRDENSYIRNVRFTLKKEVYDAEKLKVVLKLNVLEDYIYYLLLKAQPDIAVVGTPKADLPHCKWILESSTSKFMNATERLKRKDYVVNFIYTNRDKRTKLFGVLDLCGYKVANNLAAEQLYIEAHNYVDERRANMDKFYDVVTDPDLDYRLLLNMARRAAILYYNREASQWIDTGTKEPIGKNDAEIISHLKSSGGKQTHENWKVRIPAYLKEANLHY